MADGNDRNRQIVSVGADPGDDLCADYGASAGLGLEFAKLFAKDKHELILVARRRDRLESLAQELRSKQSIRAEVIEADLSTPGGVAKVKEEVARLGLEVDFLVNNAGFGSNGAFAELPAARELEMIALNVTALVELTQLFLPGMIARGRGRILNIGSTAGFQPGPYMATYYATKAFVNSFTEALAHELRGTGVTATVSCPGPTQTEFFAVAGATQSPLKKMGASRADVVALGAYRAMHAGKPMVIHGFKNKLVNQSLRISPRFAIRALVASLNRTQLKALK